MIGQEQVSIRVQCTLPLICVMLEHQEAIENNPTIKGYLDKALQEYIELENSFNTKPDAKMITLNKPKLVV